MTTITAPVGDNHKLSRKQIEPPTGGSPSLLDGKETTVHPILEKSYRRFLIAGNRKAIDHAKHVYASIDDRDGLYRVVNYVSCRGSAWFVRNKWTGEIRVASNRCKLRWCPMCCQTTRYVITQSVKDWLKDINRPKFLTLTLKHSDDSLSNQIDRLYDSFKKLRRHSFWKKTVHGGIWFFQITKNLKTDQWHPHLHVLMDCGYLSHGQLSDIWQGITTDSKIVDIRPVKNPKKTIDYVARYASSPCRLDKYDLANSIIIVDSMFGRRANGTFGTGKRIQLHATRPDDPGDWIYFKPFWQVHDLKDSDPIAIVIWHAWKTGIPCVYEPDRPPDQATAINDMLYFDPEAHKQLLLF